MSGWPPHPSRMGAVSGEPSVLGKNTRQAVPGPTDAVTLSSAEARRRLSAVGLNFSVHQSSARRSRAYSMHAPRLLIFLWLFVGVRKGEMEMLRPVVSVRLARRSGGWLGVGSLIVLAMPATPVEASTTGSTDSYLVVY